jgi:transposase-like protein/IS1 family transposase
MKCPACQQEGRKFGKDRHGNQRYQCVACKKTFSDRPAKPLDEMTLPLDKAITVLKLLTEGNSIRATVRLSGVAKDTVTALLVNVGEKCAEWLARNLQGLEVEDVQADEIWSFVGMKEKTKRTKSLEANEGIGDAWCFVAIERYSKIVLSWYLGKRDGVDTGTFIESVKNATRGRFQLTTDAWVSYPGAVQVHLEGRGVDYARLLKVYGPSDEGRYSPGVVRRTEKTPCCGNPDPNAICTSHVERHNLSMRMQNRRLTRLTNAFSKKWRNHEAALGLYFMVYNFVRPHGTLTKRAEGERTTPAMSAGLTDHPWTLPETLGAISTQD